MGIMIVLGIAVLAVINSQTANALPTGNVAEGMYVYEEMCASCHGSYAEGTIDGPPLIGEGFAAATKSRDEMAEAISVGSAAMHDYELPRQDVADTIAYLRQIQAYGGT